MEHLQFPVPSLSSENDTGTGTASFQIIAGTFSSLGEHIVDAQGFNSQHLCPFPRDAPAFIHSTDIPGAVTLHSPAVPSSTALTAGQEEVQLQHRCWMRIPLATGAGCLILYMLCQKYTLLGA